MTDVLFQTALTAYTVVLMYRQVRANCLAIAATYSHVRSISHDAVSRLLQKEGHKWNIFLRKKFRHLVNTKGGYLIIDDTVIPKPFSTLLHLVDWVWSSSENRAIRGISCVMLLWTDGITRLPLGVKFYDPATKSERSKITLALELLYEARNYWKIKPDFVLFDAWYGADKIFQRIRKYKWHFITRLKSNRLLDGQSAEEYFPYRYGHAVVRLSNNMRVLAVKDDDRFLATSKLTLSVQEVKHHYQQRQWIEELFRILKEELRLADCSSRSPLAQENHVWFCLLAFCQLEQQRLEEEQPVTMYQLRRKLLHDNMPLQIHIGKQIKHAA